MSMVPDDSDGEDLPQSYDWQKYKVRSQPNTTYNPNKKRDVIDTFFSYVNRDLLICKLFYFFFFAAFGSLFPLLAIYFKQLGMNPSQSGILIGFRPFVEFCSAPFWGGLADRYKKGKQLLIFSLVCWIIFTLSIAFVSPPPHHCHETNATWIPRDQSEYKSSVWRGKREAIHEEEFPHGYSQLRYKREKEVPFANEQNGDKKTPEPKNPELPPSPTKGPSQEFVPLSSTQKSGPEVPYKVLEPSHDKGTAPVAPGGKHTPTRIDDGDYIKPKYSTIYYDKGAVKDAFFTLLLLIIIGEFFSAPAITFADSVTLAYLGEDTENYGRQRMFGSLGWGLSMFFVGLALDQSTTFPNHPCEVQYIAEKNYMLCFAVFTVLMSFALITATQLKFTHQGNEGKEFQLIEFVEKVKDTVLGTISGKRPLDRATLFGKNEDDDFDYLESKASMQRQMEAQQNGVTDLGQGQGYGQGQIDQGQTIEGQQDQSTNPANTQNGKNVQISLEEKKKDMVSDVTSVAKDNGAPEDEDPFLGKWLAVMRMLSTYKYLSVIFIAWFMGFGIGLIFTFLFWHLQDLGGSPTLFGLASVFNHISELLAYFLSRKIICRFGHIKVLYAGLLGNIVRFLYISFLRNPWWVLPFEFVQGLTHAAVWAACCSYITQAIPLGLRASAQGILQGFHHGLGRGCGAVIGGLLVSSFGAEVTFRVYAVTCVVVLGFFVLGNYFLVRGNFTHASGRSHFNHSMLEEDETDDNQCHLAPHGVPSGIARDLSSSRLKDEGISNYGATYYKQDSKQEDQLESQGIVMNQPPQAPTQIYQQQPYNRYDQNYGP